MHSDEYIRKYTIDKIRLEHKELSFNTKTTGASNIMSSIKRSTNPSVLPIELDTTSIDCSNIDIEAAVVYSSINPISNNTSVESASEINVTIKNQCSNRQHHNGGQNTLERIQNYVSNADSNRHNSNQYLHLHNEKTNGNAEISEFTFMGITTSPQSVSSNCSNGTGVSASNSLQSTCNTACENGVLMRAYSPPTSNASGSSAKSGFDSSTESVHREQLKTKVSKPFSVNLSPNVSRSPSGERSKLNSSSSANGRKRDKEMSKNFGRKDVIPQRKRRDFIPEELKDEHYWERRRKNNLAAKRSREKRRLNDLVLETKVIELTNENNVSKLKLDLLMKKFKITEDEVDKLFEENRHLLVITESIEISDFTNDSNCQDFTNDMDLENLTKDNDSEMKVINNPSNFSSKSSCSSNSSINENSSGEELTKKKKVEVIKIKRKSISESEVSQKFLQLNGSFLPFNEQGDKILSRNETLEGCKKEEIDDNEIYIESKIADRPLPIMCNELSNGNEATLARNQYPLLYNQLCRALCNTAEKSNYTTLNDNKFSALDDNFFIKTGKNELISNSETQNKLKSVKDSEKATLSSQELVNSSYSECCRGNKEEDNKTCLKNMHLPISDIRNVTLNEITSHDVINSIVDEYLKNQYSNKTYKKVSASVMNKIPESCVTVNGDLFNHQMEKYKNLIRRTHSINEQQNFNPLSSTLVNQINVNKFCNNKDLSDKLNRSKKRHIQGNPSDVSDQHTTMLIQCDKETLSSLSSSDLSNDEEGCLNKNNFFTDNQSMDIGIEHNFENIQEKLKNCGYLCSGKIRRVNEKNQSQNNINKADEKLAKAIELINRNTLDTTSAMTTHSSQKSYQDILAYSVAKYPAGNAPIINNPFSNADNMPLKLRFKMLQLKTGEVN